MHTILETGFNRRAKNICRDKLFADLPPMKSILTLPSTERLCVEKLQEFGVINEDTQQVWIECERPIARILEDVAGENTEVLRMKLEEYQGEAKFDLINADTMTSFGQRQALAMQNLAGNLNKGGTFILWSVGWPRAPSAVQFREYFQQRLDSDLGWLKEDVHKGVSESIARAGFVEGDLYDEESITQSMVATISLARCAMAKYRYRVAMMGAYRDGIPMLAIRFDDITSLRDKPADLPLATDLMADYNASYNAPTASEADIQKMVFEKSAGSHTVVLISDGQSPKWVLLSPTGKSLKTTKNIDEIASFYRTT